MEEPRAKKLMRLVQPDQGDLGLYMRCFIQQAQSRPELMRNALAQKTFHSLLAVNGAYDPLDDEKRTGLGHAFKHQTKSLTENEIECYDNLEMHAEVSIAHVLSTFVAECMKNINEELFKESIFLDLFGPYPLRSDYRLRMKKCPIQGANKLKSRAFKKAAAKLYNEAGTFVRSPKVIVEEGVDTMQQVSKWVSMYAGDMDEALKQMKYMLKPTVHDPRTNKMISPIEMLGYGNNGYIGGFINGQFPTHINGHEIIRVADEDNPSIIHPEFAKMWFDRDLNIGGCPALVHRNRMGEVFMDFAKLYVDCAEKVVSVAKQQPVISNDVGLD